MTNEEARKFAFDSYVTAFLTAFEAKNKYIIDQYFAADLEMYNHSVTRSYNLQQIKLSIPEFHKKYRDVKSEVKDVIVDGNCIAFRVEHRAYFVPDDEYVHMDVMNLYKLVNGKVKVWKLWFTQDPDLSKNI